MRSLRKVESFTLEWAQTSVMSQSFELRGDGAVVATLEWEKLFGSLATARTADGTWTFKRGGFLTPIVTVRAPGSEKDLAVLTVVWGGGGDLAIAGTRTYAWKRRGFWSGQWGFEWIDGGHILHFEPKFSIAKRKAELHLEPAAHAVPELPLLATLGWYLLILMAQDEASSVAIIS